MKYKSGITSLVAILALLIVAGPSVFQSAAASQISAQLVPEFDSGTGTFSGVRFIEIDYPAGSAISHRLNGINERISFVINASSADRNLAPMISSINKNLLEKESSPAQVGSADLRYTGSIKGTETRTNIAITVDVFPKFSGFVLSRNSSGDNMILDMNWRGFSVQGPVTVPWRNGSIDINSPAGLLNATQPALAAGLLATDAREMLNAPILDFGEIGKARLDTWHYLFDPTKILVTNWSSSGFNRTGSASVISVYSLGECNLQSCPLQDARVASATVDGVSVVVHAVSPPANAQIQVAGYSTIQGSGGSEVLSVNLHQPPPLPIDTTFPFQVLLVLGGMMGAIALFVLVKAKN